MKKLGTLLLVALLALLPLASLAEGKTLTMQDGEWLGTDLYQCANWTGLQDLISDSFFIQDPEDPSNILPSICEKMEVSEDGLTIRLTFPEGFKYANGVDLKPEDFVACVKYGQTDSDWGDGYSNIESMEIDGNDVICHLSDYRSDLIYFLSHAFMGMISADQINTLTKDELLWQAVPYGQFYVDEVVLGSHIILKPNPYYKTNNPLVENKGPSNLESITIRTADVEAFTLNIELVNGELDVLGGIDMDQYAELKDVEGITVLDNTFPNIEYFEINKDSPHLDDIRVRQAIMLALDRESMEIMCRGSLKPEYSMITPNVQNYSQEAADWFLENLANDVDRAKELLAEAGYEAGKDGYLFKDGSRLEFTFLARSSGTSVTMAQDMQLQMKDLGIMMNIETIDWNYIYDRIDQDDYDMGIETLGWGEPILVLNYCYYDQNSLLDSDAYYALVEQCATTPDTDERTELVRQIQMLMYEDCAIVPLYSDVEYMAYRNDIEGLKVTQTGYIFFNDIP